MALLAHWMYDHTFIMQKSLLYFEGQMTYITNTTEVFRIQSLEQAEHPLPNHAGLSLEHFLNRLFKKEKSSRNQKGKRKGM